MSKRQRNRSSKTRPGAANDDADIDDDNDDNWFSIKSISAERRSKKGRREYLVEWDDLNPETGKSYPASWVPAGAVSSAAIAEWRELRKKKPTKASLQVHTNTSTSPLKQGEKRSREGTTLTSPTTRSDITSSPGTQRIHKKRRLGQNRSAGSPGPSVTGLSSATTDTPESEFPSQSWGQADEGTRNGRDLVVEIQKDNEVDRSEYISLHLPSQSRSQQSYYSLSSYEYAGREKSQSQRTIPDSQDLSSQALSDQPVTSRPEDLSTVLGLPRLSPAPSLHLADSSNNNSIPSHQPDPLRLLSESHQHIFLSRSASVPAQQSGSSGSLVNSRIADSQFDGGGDSPPRFRSQASFSLPPLRRSSQPTSPLHLTRSSNTGGDSSSQSHPQAQARAALPALLERTPDSTSGLGGSSQQSQAQTSHPSSLRRYLAGAGGDRSGSSPQFMTQAPFSLPSLRPSHTPAGRVQLGLSNSSDSVVAETVLRRPSSYKEKPKPTAGDNSPRSPTRSPRQGRGHLPPKSHDRAKITMADNRQASEEPSAAGALLSAFVPLSSLLDDELAENSQPHPQTPPHPEPHPASVIAHDAAASVMDAIDGRAGHHVVSSMAESSQPTSTEAIPSEVGGFHATPGLVPGTEHLDFATPATVAPSEVTSLQIPSAIREPSPDIFPSTELPFTSSRRLPHQSEEAQEVEETMDSVPVTATDVARSASSSDHETRPMATSPGIPTSLESQPRDFTVTLPFSSNRRPLYLERLESARKEIDEFGAVFHNEVLRTPKPSLVYKIENLFMDLLDICDYPAGLEWSSLQKMSPKERQKHAVETNAKFAFIWDLLNELRDTPSRVLIVARSEKLLYYLESLVEAEGYAFSRKGLHDMKDAKSESDMRLVLAMPGQQLSDTAADFDVVIGYDFAYQQSTIAREMASSSGLSKQPFVFSLVLVHSIEHIDLQVLNKYPGMDDLDRKNAVLIALWRMCLAIENPSPIRYWSPYPIARQLAGLVKGIYDELDWAPTEVPEEVLDFYLDPSQQPKEFYSSNEESGEDGRKLRKRKLGDDGEAVRKRRKIVLDHEAIIDARRHAALAPFIRILGVEALDETIMDLVTETRIPVALLSGIEWKMDELQRGLDESKGHVKDLRKRMASMETQNIEYTKSINAIHDRHREAIEERGEFEYERDTAVAEREYLETKLATAMEEIEQLKIKMAEKEVDARTGPSNVPAPGPIVVDGPTDDRQAQLEKELQEAREEVTKLKKRNESTESTLEYTRKAYQDASHATTDLASENRDLKKRVEDLEGLASDSLRRIHEINTQNQLKEYRRMVDERDQMLREREIQLDRAHKELGMLKNGRRETRQASVPRSPRMGVISPRPGRGIGGSASRGTSPAPLLEAALPTGMTYNGTRWGHLRDQY